MIPVTKQLALKIKLERIFTPEITKIFNAMTKDFRIVVAQTGMPPDIKGYKAVFEVLLKNHFQRVHRAFTGAVKQADDPTEHANLVWRNKFAPEDADWIAETTKANMTEAINQARELAAEELRIASTQELSADATAILKRKLRNRIDRIVNTETQKAAEAAKFTEAEVISNIKPRILGGSRNQQTGTRKQWMTVGDKRVRPAHRLANGQIRNLNDPFEVGGEYLMHPGDNSMGATIGNLANCRCISKYIFI